MDLSTLNSRKEARKKRTKCKKTNFGLSSLMTEICFGGALLTALLGTAFIQYERVITETADNMESFKQAEAVASVYPLVSELSN